MRARTVWWVLLIAAAATAWPVLASPSLPDGLTAGEKRVVREVIDGDTVVLDDRRQVRLVGIQAPKLPLDRPNFKTWPLADEAKAALERLALGQTVSLHYGATRIDRNRRVLAHLVDAGGRWLQGEMLELGLARVYTFPDNRAAAAEMLAIEREARAKRRGIWAHPYYQILSPDAAAGALDSFQLVEGRVLNVGSARGRIFLNFGRDWRSDFTVVIPSEARRDFVNAGLDPDSLAGLRIRVRGWIRSRDGPMIEATHPEQIEVLGR